MGAKQILLVDDDREIRDLFKEFLSQHDYIVTTVNNGQQCLEQVKKRKFDLILLDLLLPDSFGGELCKTIRMKTITPILILTASDSDLHYIVSLNSGADDFIQKSNSMEVILAKINAILRRESAQAGTMLAKDIQYSKAHFSGWTFIPKEKILITSQEAEVFLTDNENKLMMLFIEQNNKIITRDTIADCVGLSSSADIVRAVDTLVCRFRNKLKRHRCYKNFLKTVRGKGYKLMVKVKKEDA